jgi:hypothetical protein
MERGLSEADSFSTTYEILCISWNPKMRKVLLRITNKMQPYTLFFIAVNALHVSDCFSAHHQELKTVHTASGICQACLLLPLAVAVSKLDSFMLCVQFSAPDDGRRNRLKHVQH